MSQNKVLILECLKLFMQKPNLFREKRKEAWNNMRNFSNDMADLSLSKILNPG